MANAIKKKTPKVKKKTKKKPTISVDIGADDDDESNKKDIPSIQVIDSTASKREHFKFETEREENVETVYSDDNMTSDSDSSYSADSEDSEDESGSRKRRKKSSISIP